MSSLSAKPIALVTGGQRGIGWGISRELAVNGYDLALTARSAADHEDVLSACAELKDLGARVCYVSHDLSDITAFPVLLDRIVDELGPPSALIANAGVPAKIRGDLLDVQPDSFDIVMNTNLRGNFFLAQAVARQMTEMRSQHYRSIVFVTSVSADMVSIERGEYCMSKAGAAMMVQLFAHRLARLNIGVFELRPGIIETGMTARVHDKYTKLIADGLVPAGRWGKPADIGKAVLPLVTGDMSFATGTVVCADGGLSIHKL